MSGQTDYRKIILGICAAFALVIGIFLATQQTDVSSRWSGSWIRAGALLGVIWLAYDQIRQMSRQLPALSWGMLVVGVLFVATRPNLGKIVIAVAVVAIAFSSIWLWLKSNSTPNRS